MICHAESTISLLISQHQVVGFSWTEFRSAERSHGMYANQAKVANDAALYLRFSPNNSSELNGKVL